MKQYPSIQGSGGQRFREFEAYVFDKLDGSNLRMEWTRKAGWNKFGTRTRLFDENDLDFGSAIPIFRRDWELPLTEVARLQRWNHLVVFMEFWGEKSFAGKHDTADQKKLTLFDACADKKGLLGPRDFLDAFDGLATPKFFGIFKWTRGFVDRVRSGTEPAGLTFEGVVGKAGSRHELIMAKAKTQAWVDKVLAQYGEAEGRKLVES
jgi:hypothetical protein